MKTIKKIGIIFTSFMLFFAMLFGFSLLLQNRTKVARATTSDFTQFSKFEQEELNQQIKNKWGNPTQIIKLDTNATTLVDSSSSTDIWYYLASDIQVNITETLEATQAQHIRILLNGYSISGTFNVTVKNRNTLSIFDKIPTITTGEAYQYNPTPNKCYAFNTSTNAYSDCTIRTPAGTDVTNAPSFLADTFIATSGSAFAPNTQNAAAAQVSLKAENGYINAYNINIIGVENVENILTITEGGQIDIEQSMVVGNTITGNAAVELKNNTSSVLYTSGNKIYGNKTTKTEAGVRPSNENLSNLSADLHINQGSMTLYRNRIGAVTTANFAQAWYMQDTNFNSKMSTLTADTLLTTIKQTSDIEGVLELVYGIALEYTGISPNLHIIVHGTDYATNGATSKLNLLTSATNSVLGNITSVYSSVFMPEITIHGTVKGLSTTGNVTVAATANVLIQENQTVNSLKNNQGTIEVAGTITRIADTSVGGIFTILKTGSATIGSGNLNLKIVNQGQLTIEGATVSDVELAGGVLNLNGTITNLTLKSGEIVITKTNATLQSNIVLPNEVTLTVAENASYTIPFISNGTVNVKNGATVESLTLTDGVLNLYGTVRNLTFEKGLINVLDSTAKLQENIAIPSAGKMEIAKNISVSFSIVNGGTLVVHQNALIETLTNVDNGSLYVEGKVLILDFVGGSITLASSSAMLPSTVEIPVNGVVTILDGVSSNANYVNNGTLYVNNGAVVDNILTSGTTIIAENCKIASVLISGGYTDIRNNATVKNAQLQEGGKLEIRAKAKVENLTYSKSKGVLIDHRANVQFILIVSISAGGVLLLVILMTVLLVIFGKKKKKQRASGALGRFEDRLQQNSCINKKKLAVSRYDDIDSITTNRIKSIIPNSTKTKKKKKR